MKFRSMLTFFSLFLALAVSADRTAAPCPGCWLASRDAPTIDQSFGVNIHFTDPQPGEIKMIADAGFRWVRMDLKWDATERERGRYDFTAYDRLMTAIEPFGLRALFILDYGNPLYGEGAPRTEEARNAFARWAVATARHFANRGVMWEVYNEPNNAMFWQPTNANEYASLAITVGKAFRESVPNEKLMGPAVGEMDFSFLDSCFKAGALDAWFAVSVHPYLRGNPENVAGDYAKLRELIVSYKTPGGSAEEKQTGANIPIISGEWGYSAAWRRMNEEKQGMMLARQFLTNAANGIPVSIWYDWRDDGVDPKEPEHHFGLVRNEYRNGQTQVYEPKPAYLAAKTLLRHFNGFRFEQRLLVGADDDYVLVFSKGGERRMAVWTTSPGKKSLKIPIASGQFNITNMKGEDGGGVSSDQGFLAIKLSNAPVYLAPGK
jgi:polysaccharide biosynthesis protein PslG